MNDDESTEKFEVAPAKRAAPDPPPLATQARFFALTYVQYSCTVQGIDDPQAGRTSPPHGTLRRSP